MEYLGVRQNTFVVEYRDQQCIFIADTHQRRIYTGTVAGVPVRVDWTKYPAVAIHTPGRVFNGSAENMGILSLLITHHLADALALPDNIRAHYHYPFSYIAVPTGLHMGTRPIYIVAFADGSGWLYSAGEYETTEYQTAIYPPDIIPSKEHCMTAFIHGAFIAGRNV